MICRVCGADCDDGELDCHCCAAAWWHLMLQADDHALPDEPIDGHLEVADSVITEHDVYGASPVWPVAQFVAYAGQVEQRWRYAIGCRVVHRALGVGTIIDIDVFKDTVISLIVEFRGDRHPRHLHRHVFTDQFFSGIVLPP